MTDDLHDPSDRQPVDALRRRLAASVRDARPSERLRATVLAAAGAETGGAPVDVTLTTTTDPAARGSRSEPYGRAGANRRRRLIGSVSWRSSARVAAVLLPLVLVGSVFLSRGGDGDAVRAVGDDKARPTVDVPAPPSTRDPNEIAPEFLDLLAPVSGDAGSRARERSDLALARAATGPKATCMTEAGFPEYKDLGLMRAADFSTVHSQLLSPTKLEHRGFVSIADRRLDEIPEEADIAWGRCSGEVDGIKAAAGKVDDFIVYRDSDANPLGGWPQDVVQAEVARIAQSDDARYEQYRECFQEMGIPAEDARDPGDAFSTVLTSQNQAVGPIDPALEERWRNGEAVLDPDGGAGAKQFATCLRLFEQHLTPVLEQRRTELVEQHRGAILEGQTLLFEAIGGEAALARETTRW